MNPTRLTKTFAAAIAVLAILPGALAEGDAATDEANPKKPRDLAAAFAKMDADSNGELTKEEAQAARRKMPPEKIDKMFELKDADGNGSLSVEEFTAKPAKKENAPGEGGGGAVSEQQ